MPSYRRSRRRTSPARRKLVWARASGTLVPPAIPAPPALPAPAATDLLAPFEAAYGAQLIGCTIMRVRGLVALSGAPQVNTLVFSRVTLHVTDQRLTVLLPAPTDNAYDANSGSLDYMMFEPMFGPFIGDDVSFDGNPELPGRAPAGQRIIDVRAKRKLSELNQSLILRASQRAGAATAAPVVNYDLSILVALP